MAFPADYTLLGDLGVPTITGAHTDYVALITYNDFTTAMLSQLDNGGGDLRISDDQSGATQLPIDVVEFDKVGNSVQVWVKIPSAFTGKKIYVWGNNTGDMQPTVTDSYGRNAVWSNVIASYPMSDNSGNDSTGSNPLSTVATSTVNGVYGKAQQFNGQVFDGAITGLSTTTRYISAWVKPDSLTDNQYISTLIGGTRNNLTAIILGYQDRFINAYDENYPTGNANQTKLAVSSTEWTKFVYQWSGGRLKGYANGVEIFDVSTTMFGQLVGNIRIGSSSASDYYYGALQGYELSNTAKSADLIATEYQNQSANGWFIPSDNAGGMDVNVPILVNSSSVFVPEEIQVGIPNVQFPLIQSTVSVQNPEILSGSIVQAGTVENSSNVHNPEVLYGKVLQAELVQGESVVYGVSIAQPLSIEASKVGTDSVVFDLYVLSGDGVQVPVDRKQTMNEVCVFLREMGFKGSNNDVLMQWMFTEGIEDGGLNDRFNQYLKSQGLDGTLTDMKAEWKKI